MTDMHLPIDTLLAEARGLRRLALVSDPTEADDLVQDTLTRALSSRAPTTGSVRGWLGQILRSRAKERWRESMARAAREAARREWSAVDPADEVVERADAHRRLVEEVMALDETSRAVLLKHFFDGLDTRTIAARTGVKPSTVRSRLQRALAALRRRLEVRDGDSAKRWLLAIVAAPEARLSLAAVGARVGTVAAAGALAFGAWQWSDGATREVPRDAAMTTPTVKLEAPLSRHATRVAIAPEEQGDRTPLEEPATEKPMSEIERRRIAATAPRPFVVNVRIDGKPAGDGMVSISESGWLHDSLLDSDFELERIDSAGQARFVAEPRATRTVAAQLATGGPLFMSGIRSSNELTMRLGTASIEGRVYLFNGMPAAGVMVTLGVQRGHDYGSLQAMRVTDDDGRFAFDHLPKCSYSLYIVLGGGGSERLHGSLAQGELRTFVFGPEKPEREYRGRVVDADGRALAGVEPYCGGGVTFWRDADGVRNARPARLDPDGTFELRLAPGRWTVQVNPHAEGTTATIENVDVDPATDLRITLPGARIHGAALVQKQGAIWDPERHGDCDVKLVSADRPGEVEPRRTRVGADGRFTFDGVPIGRWRLVSNKFRAQGSYDALVIDDAPVRVDVVVEP